MSEKNAKGCLAAAAVWVVIVIILGIAVKYFVLPYFQEELTSTTGSDSQYRVKVRLALDSFSGYCVLRSDEMRQLLKKQGVRLELADDNADYAGRMKNLANGKLDMAVFTVDSFILAGTRIGNFPATIVMLIDETKGADAIVAYKRGVASIQDLDDKNARIVLTPNSPSEFLARTVIAHFSLPNLPDDWIEKADGAADVLKKFKLADQSEKRVYALWEPYVSKALAVPGAHLLLDSSRLKGCIVDVLVAERKFLRENSADARAVVEAYLRAAYAHSRKSGGMVELLITDAATGADKLTPDDATRLAERIEWKNTLENFEAFGLTDGAPGRIQHIEDIIANIAGVLEKTGAIERFTLRGRENTIFYSAILKELRSSGFHPGKQLNVVSDLGLGADDLDTVRTTDKLKPLTDEQWRSLVSVGRLRIDPISFARGTARINLQSKRDIDALAAKLSAFPHYYLKITGHARAEGDPEANRKLSLDRAKTVLEHLATAGTDAARMRCECAPPDDRSGDAQAVTFEVGQLPY